jgi:hypothetical protein
VRDPTPSRPLTVQAGPKLLTFDLARTAIVVVDMQNDFCHPDGWLAYIGVDVAPARAPIEPLRRLLPALRQADVPVIWRNWGNRPDRLNLSPALLHVYNPTGDGVSAARLWGACTGTWQAGRRKSSMNCCPEPKDIHVAKYRMSGFRDPALTASYAIWASLRFCLRASTWINACSAPFKRPISMATTASSSRTVRRPPHLHSARKRLSTTFGSASAS